MGGRKIYFFFVGRSCICLTKRSICHLRHSNVKNKIKLLIAAIHIHHL